MDRRLYWIWLQQRLALGSITVNRLCERFEDIEAVYAADAKTLAAVSLKPQEIQKLQDKSLDLPCKILQAMQQLGGWVLTPEDANYPELLRQIDGFPAVLYGEGMMPPLNRLPSMAMVGTRNASKSGVDTAYMLAGSLAAAGMVIISGGARGIDTAAHAGALAVNGKTVLVKACAPESDYPRCNSELRRQIVRSGGAVVTEYAPGVPCYCDYHVRNRLITGMAYGTCMGETPQRSGALISAGWAREQGRDLFAIPAAIHDGKNAGAHQEIRKGAILVTSAADILEEYAVEYPGMLDKQAAQAAEQMLQQETAVSRPVQPLQKATAKVANDAPLTELPDTASPEAKKLLAVLSTDPCPIDRLAELAGLQIADALVLLTELEILGCAKSTAGQQYYRT